MKTGSGTLLAVCVVGLMFVGSAWSKDYYVAPDGDDGGQGSLEKPFKSPVSAAAKLMPGDTLYFRKGTYTCRTDGIIGLAPSRDGEEGKPITFKTYNGEHVVINVGGADWGFTNNGFNWIVIDGFEITGGTKTYNMKIASHHGGAKKGTGHHVTIRNCEVHHSQNENIFCHSTPYLVIENCYLHHSTRSHGLYMQVGCHNPVVRHVTSEHNQGNSGMQLNATGGGITNALIENCLLRYNAQGFSTMGVQKSIYRNNVIFNNGFDGVRGSGWRELIMWTYGSADKPGTLCDGITFENNTFVNVVPPGHKLNNLVRSKSDTKNVTFRNNIFAVRGKPVFTLESFEGFVFENNCLQNIGGGSQVNSHGDLAGFAKAKGLKESGTIAADPMFVDIDKGDLRLKKDSPCPKAGAFAGGAKVRIGAKLPWVTVPTCIGGEGK